MDVEFAGFLISTNSVKPTKKMIETILHFLTPMSIRDIRSCFGLVNQISYAFAQVEMMASFQELLHTKNQKFYWNELLECLFRVEASDHTKDSERCQDVQNQQKNVFGNRLQQDRNQLLFIPEALQLLWQGEPELREDDWKLILAGSHFTNDAESRYTPVE